jgi:hypothetical protein
MKRRNFVLGGAAAALPVGVAHAYIVFDPTNYVQNTISAIKTTLQEILAVKAEIDRLLQLKELIKSTISAGPEALAKMAGLDLQLGDLAKILDIGQKIHGVLGSGKTFGERITALYGAFGGDFKSFVKTQAEQALRGNERARAMFEEAQSIAGSIKDVANIRKQVLQAAGAAVGQTGAIQVNTGMLDVLVGEQQKMNSMMAAVLRDMAEDKGQKSAEAKVSAESGADWFGKYFKRSEAGMVFRRSGSTGAAQ